MAHLPPILIAQRRTQLYQELLALWQPLHGQEWYALMCPCNIDCRCMPEEEVPRMKVDLCYYPGELDYFFVRQPFQQLYNFRVRWHCDECHSEMACGDPTPINVHAALGHQA